MSEHVQLIGADDVRSAGNKMRYAAEDMLCAANTISEALDRQRVFMDDWLARFETALTNERILRIHANGAMR